jgi:excisionase family DNA binding protein
VTPVLLPREVADLLRVPESTVRAWTRDGRLRGYRTSGGGC